MSSDSRAAPKGDSPDVSVLVVSSGRSALLQTCLRRVRAQADRLGAEVVLVVNDAPQQFPGELKDALMPLVDRLDFEPRVGKSHALNRGVRLSRGHVVALTDDDTMPQERWLETITGPLLDPDRPPDVVGSGGRVLPVFEDEVPAWYDRLTSGHHTHFLGPRHDLGDEPRQYGKLRCAPLGANCAYLRQVLVDHPYRAELGPNRQTGLRGGEDFELGLRLTQEGYRLLYCPGARVEHPVSPKRLTLDYVSRGYQLQGIERARMDHALGRGRPPIGFLPKLLYRKLVVRLHGRGETPARVRDRMKLRKVSARFAETVRIHHSDPTFPDEPSLGDIVQWCLHGFASRPERRAGSGSRPSE